MTMQFTSMALGAAPATPRRRAGLRMRRLVPLVLIAAAALAFAAIVDRSPTAALAMGPAPMVGVFTGEFVDGAPVYRLPPLEIVASRGAELARMRREQDAVHARRAAAKVAVPAPARLSDTAEVLRVNGPSQVPDVAAHTSAHTAGAPGKAAP